MIDFVLSSSDFKTDFYFQVYKILINEHSALPPPAIVEFINYYFEQHNRFHYNQFIQLNYKANLNMIRHQLALEGGTASGGPTGPGNGPGGPGGPPVVGPGGVGNLGANMGGIGGPLGGIGGSLTSNGTLSNRKMKDFFQSIYYYRYEIVFFMIKMIIFLICFVFIFK